MSNSASKRLVTGTVIYMVGNLMSKVLQMLILPIITVSLATSEYGYYDLIITTINLVSPIVTFQMIEGMFRFMFSDSKEEKKNTVSTVTAFLVIGFIVLGVLMWSGNIIFPKLQYPGWIYLNYVSLIIFSYAQKLARCQQKNKEFAASGVLNTIVMLGLQALTLIVFKMGIDGMLIANCVSYFIASFYLATVINLKEWLSIKSVKMSVFRKLFKYSIPLVPNSMCWWLVSSSDRYVITFFIDAAANGIYAIAGKFAQFLTFVTSVFQLAWQESAILEADSDERDKFYTRTFNNYMRLLMGGFIVVLPFIRIIMPFLLSESYRSGYIYNPVLLVGAVFSAFSQFYGSAYLVFKKTGGAFTTTVVAAVINVMIGIGFVKYIGLFAPALGTMVSFMIQWLLRTYQMREYFKVKIDKKDFSILFVFMSISTWVYYLNSMVANVVSFGSGVIIFLLFNRSFVRPVINKLFNKK